MQIPTKDLEYLRCDHGTSKHVKEMDEQIIDMILKDSNVENLTKFHLFPKLAVELRLPIWNMVLPGPRLVELEFRPVLIPGEEFPPRVFVCTSHCPPPVILSVCRESREEALKEYKLPFAMTRTPIYFHPLLDTLFLSVKAGWNPVDIRPRFNNPILYEQFTKGDLGKVRHLCIGFPSPFQHRRLKNWLIPDKYDCFPSLETITFALDNQGVGCEGFHRYTTSLMAYLYRNRNKNRQWKVLTWKTMSMERKGPRRLLQWETLEPLDSLDPLMGGPLILVDRKKSSVAHKASSTS